jgi:hypothetical protein
MTKPPLCEACVHGTTSPSLTQYVIFQRTCRPSMSSYPAVESINKKTSLIIPLEGDSALRIRVAQVISQLTSISISNSRAVAKHATSVLLVLHQMAINPSSLFSNQLWLKQLHTTSTLLPTPETIHAPLQAP